jgi:hypothetical protein
VPQNKDLKRLVRARMAETGEHYTQALAHLRGLADLEPLPAAWHITGSRAPDYEAGILPGITYGEDRVAQLRLRATVAKPDGFGALLSGAGAVDLARLRFEEASEDTPVTTTITIAPLPDEPQSLDFGVAP